MALIPSHNAQKMKFSIKDLFSKCDQIRRKLRIRSHLLKKSLMEDIIFYAVSDIAFSCFNEKKELHFKCKYFDFFKQEKESHFNSRDMF